MTNFIEWFNIHPVIGTLLTLILVDIVLGLIAAWGAKVLNSTASWRGMTRKAAELLLVVAAIAFEPQAQGIPIGTLVPVFFCTTEIMSIVEKAALIGVPIPKALTDVLAKVKDKKPVETPKI